MPTEPPSRHHANAGSALMRVIITKATFSNARATAILGVEDVGDLGKLCFVQLAELRHRGAFSTVAQTFASCCLRCSQIDDPAVQRLPKAWYEVSSINTAKARAQLTPDRTLCIAYVTKAP